MSQKYKSASEKEVEKVETQLKSFEEDVKNLNLDRMNQAPVLDVEPQTKISQRDLDKKSDLYLKPKRTIGSKEKFNEKFRAEYEFSKEYVYFTAENNEIIGESVQFWIKNFPGCPAEEWDVPCNKPLWAPRYVAERIKGCRYHRMRTEDAVTSDQGDKKYYGALIVDNTIQRLDAKPSTKQKSIFMGSNEFPTQKQVAVNS
jgi:hypothetical protein